MVETKERNNGGLGRSQATPAVQDLLASPKLVLHVRRFKEVLEQEHKRRETFQSEAPVDQKAEFINGEIVVSEPVSEAHAEAKERLHALLRTYVRLLQSYQRGRVGTIKGERMLVSLTRNDYEPDLCFFGTEKTRDLAPEQWGLPAPDLIAEVLSPSSAERARGVKFDDYAAHGISEYWLIDPDAEEVEQYVLEPSPNSACTGRYTLRMKAKNGILESVVVEGFRTPVRALFDNTANIEAMRELL